jgi:hypothetical protein
MNEKTLEIITVGILSLGVLLVVIYGIFSLVKKRGSKLLQRRKDAIAELEPGTKIIIGTEDYDCEAKFICLIGDNIHVKVFKDKVEVKETVVLNSDRYICKK